MKGVILAPPAVHRALLLAAPVLIVGAFVVAFARPGTPLFWALVGAGVALVAVASRARASDRGCAFCGRDGQSVAFLISGLAVSVCPDCAAAASARAEDELARRGLSGEWTRMFLAGLPERAPVELSRPHVERLIAQDRSPEGIRASVACCLRFGHHRRAQELLEAVPEPERAPSDWMNLAFALGEQGRHAEALAALRRAAPAGTEGEDPWVVANTAWYELQLDPDPPPEHLSRWLAQVADARQALQQTRPEAAAVESWSDAVASFRGIEAELLRRTGDGEAALRCLAEADLVAPQSGERLLIRARTLAALGRSAEAAAEAARALQLLRPDARGADEARRLAAAGAGPAPAAER
jgi:tetratricopeptide (TPR) repeat protein